MASYNTRTPAGTISLLRSLAEDRWGDVPVTLDVLLWDDGDFAVTAFYTICSSETAPLPDDFAHLRAELTRDADGDLYERITATYTNRSEMERVYQTELDAFR